MRYFVFVHRTLGTSQCGGARAGTVVTRVYEYNDVLHMKYTIIRIRTWHINAECDFATLNMLTLRCL